MSYQENGMALGVSTWSAWWWEWVISSFFSRLRTAPAGQMSTTSPTVVCWFTLLISCDDLKTSYRDLLVWSSHFCLRDIGYFFAGMMFFLFAFFLNLTLYWFFDPLVFDFLFTMQCQGQWLLIWRVVYSQFDWISTICHEKTSLNLVFNTSFTHLSNQWSNRMRQRKMKLGNLCATPSNLFYLAINKS